VLPAILRRAGTQRVTATQLPPDTPCCRNALILHATEQKCLSVLEASPFRNQRPQEGAGQRAH
jgi:hypothetical protein